MKSQPIQTSFFDVPIETDAGTLIETDPAVIAYFGPLPQRLLILHRTFGSKPGETCINCKFFWTKHGVNHRECLWNHGAKNDPTNWIASWPACGQHVAGDAHAEAKRQGRE